MPYELARTPPASGLAELASLLDQRKLDPVIAARAPLSDIARVADDLMHRRFAGKAVLTVDAALA
jgi:NADPH:quinone reductase-like Zn-dependent oxidoreductase